MPEPSPPRAAWAEAHAVAIAEQRAGVAAALGALVERTAGTRERPTARPLEGTWSPAEVLEHVVLMHRAVFVLIDKIAGRCRARIERGDPWPDAPPALHVVADLARAERTWPHPQHMTPTGAIQPTEAAAALARDRDILLAHLDLFPRGEGTLHRIRMSRIEGDDRLDLYQWVELVRRHAERHARQIDRAAGREA